MADFVVEFKAEARDQSVLALAEDHRQGHLQVRLRRHCQREWGSDQAIFVCFGESVTALGLTLCQHTDTSTMGENTGVESRSSFLLMLMLMLIGVFSGCVDAWRHLHPHT